MNLKWFATGLGVGAAVTILYAPKTGAETRQMLRKTVDDARRNANGRSEEHYTIADVLNESDEAVTCQAKAISGAVDAAPDKFSERL